MKVPIVQNSHFQGFEPISCRKTPKLCTLDPDLPLNLKPHSGDLALASESAPVLGFSMMLARQVAWEPKLEALGVRGSGLM